MAPAGLVFPPKKKNYSDLILIVLSLVKTKNPMYQRVMFKNCYHLLFEPIFHKWLVQLKTKFPTEYNIENR